MSSAFAELENYLKNYFRDNHSLYLVEETRELKQLVSQGTGLLR